MSSKLDAKLSVSTRGTYDFQLDSDGDILTEDFFDTALLMSLFCERRANSSEIPAPHLRRGWVGNEFTPGFEVGSKLWLYYQSRITLTTLASIKTTVINALQWIVDDGLAVSVNATTSVKNGNINITVDIERPTSNVERRYFDIWENTGSGD